MTFLAFIKIRQFHCPNIIRVVFVVGAFQADCFSQHFQPDCSFGIRVKPFPLLPFPSLFQLYALAFVLEPFPLLPFPSFFQL